MRSRRKEAIMIKNVSYLESSVDIVIDTLVGGVYPTFLSDRKC